jgi:predicted secreted protein
VVADALGKTYWIKHLSIGNQGVRPPVQMLRSAPMAAAMEASPLPVEAGESMVSVSVNGQIEIGE